MVQTTAVAVALALLCLPNPGRGQANGSIAGRAVATDGGLLPGVAVTVTAGSVRRTAVTGANGEFSVDGLPPGPYRVQGDLAGFRAAIVEPVDVSAGRAAETTLLLRLGIADHVDYALPADGMRGALRAADVVVYLRVVGSLGSRLLGPEETILGMQHAATVLSVVKCPPPGMVAGDRIRFWQHMAGEWREGDRLVVGPLAVYATGQEFVAFLKDEPRWGGLGELAGPHLMFPVTDGLVHGVHQAADGLRDGMMAGDFLAALQKLR